MQAVKKHDTLALMMALHICDVIWWTFSGQTEYHTPTAMARVEKPENPHRAYVVIATERG